MFGYVTSQKTGLLVPVYKQKWFFILLFYSWNWMYYQYVTFEDVWKGEIVSGKQWRNGICVEKSTNDETRDVQNSYPVPTLKRISEVFAVDNFKTLQKKD